MSSKVPGGVLLLKSYVDVPAKPRKLDILYTNFSPKNPPISILFDSKAPNFAQIGCFLQ